jgi:hypothetical protein
MIYALLRSGKEAVNPIRLKSASVHATVSITGVEGTVLDHKPQVITEKVPRTYHGEIRI